MTDMRRVRPRLDWFVDTMRAKLARPENQAKGDWRELDAFSLLSRLHAEVVELDKAVYGGAAWKDRGKDAIIKECADVANFAMMLADYARRCGPLELDTPLTKPEGTE